MNCGKRIMHAGRPFNIRPTGPSDIGRIAGGILNHGTDIMLDINPYEVGLARLVDFDEEGAKRKLAGIEIPGPAIEFKVTCWPVRAKGEDIGHVTSAIYSPRLRENIDYAMAPVEHAALGSRLEVETPAGWTGAVVVPMPFVDPGKMIPKS